MFGYGLFVDGRAVGADCTAAARPCRNERWAGPGQPPLRGGGALADAERLPLAGAAGRLGPLAHDVHAFPALDRFGGVGPGVNGGAVGRRATGGLDHGAGAPARERGAQKNGPQALGRSRGGLTTKLHTVADARGRPVRLGLTAGQRHDAPQALPLLEGLAPAYLIADRGYDSDLLVAALAARGT